MKKNLKHIAQIFSGVYFKPDLDGEIYYVQSKHFKNGIFDLSVKPELKYSYKTVSYLLEPGDVLLAIKGNNNFAVHYKGIVKMAVASSTFIVIRLWDQDNILPDYFAWYLNHPQTQLLFKDQARGTDILSLTIRFIKELAVYIPPVKKQEAILELDRLRKKEQDLTQRIAALRENQLQQQLLLAIKK